MTRLPIEVVPNTTPPRFRWRQVVNEPTGTKTVEYEATLPPTVEVALISLINLVLQQVIEISELRQKLHGFADSITAQSEILSKNAEKPAESVPDSSPSQAILKKGKGHK